MPVVLLVRHGQASFGAEDYDVLSDLGRTQSTRVGEELARRGLRDPVVVHGSLRRQRDTALLAAEAAGLDVEPHVDARLDEYDHLGLLQRYVPPEESASDGTSRGVQPLLDRALRSWVLDPDGDWPAFSDGAASALQELTGRLAPGQDAVVVTSGGIVAALGARLLGGGADTVVALNRVTANGGITTLTVGRAGTSLVAFNDHGHVRDLLTYR